MKIVVLAGGLSTERDVSLTSGAGICRTLRENGHQAFLLDVFLGFPYDSDKLEEVFTLPNAGLEIADGIKTTEPDLAAIKASREDQSDCFWDRMSSISAALQILYLWGFMVMSEKMENYRQHLIFSELNTPVQTISEVRLPWTKGLQNRFSRWQAFRHHLEPI